MAELQIVSPKSNSSTPAAIISLLILAVIAIAVFYFNPHKVAEFRVMSVDTYAPHTTFNALEGSASNMHVLSDPTASTENNLYVIANVSLTDKLRLPLFITGATARVTFADGTELESNVLSAADLKRLEVIFPDMRQQAYAPIADGDQVDPGQTRVGTLVLPFPGQTAAAWQGKQHAALTLQLRNQDPQIVALP